MFNYNIVCLFKWYNVDLIVYMLCVMNMKIKVFIDCEF